jgi:hypothetical protein
MTETKTQTATEAYNEFITENGSDVSKLTPALQATFQKLFAAKVREDKKATKTVGKREAKVSEESVQYKILAEMHGIPVSEKFAGFIEVAKPGPKNEETGEPTIAQYNIGVKAKDATGRTWNIFANVSPKNFSDDVVEAVKVESIRILAASFPEVVAEETTEEA